MKQTKRRDMRIMVSTNATFANSGYSIFARDLFYRLAQDGWNVAISAFFGVQGAPAHILYNPDLNPKLKGTSIKHYPVMDNPWGSDAMVAHAVNFQANVLFTFQDVPLLDPAHLQQLKYWVPITPVDKDPVPPMVLDRLKYAYRILTISRFGKEALTKANFASTLVLEGTDTEIFKPMDKAEARKKMGFPEGDYFLFGMVGANKENPPRKGFQEAIEAFKEFHTVHPDSKIFFHTQQNAPGNYPIKEHLHQLGIADHAFFTDDYTMRFNAGSDFINLAYNAMDVLLHPSQTEGFGLCIIESQSAGTPVIVNRAQSQPELIVDGETGWISEVSKGRFTNDLSLVYPADVPSLIEQMEKAYTAMTTDPEKYSEAARDHIVKHFNIDTMVEKTWIKLLEELQEEILGAKIEPAKQ